MSEAPPSWLSNDRPSAVSNAGTSPAPMQVEPAGGVSNSNAAADEKDLPGMILTMRLANMGAAGFLIAISITMLIPPKGLSVFVLAIYAAIGGLLICCLETQLKFLRVMIAVNFGFLFNSGLRFLYYMILGSVAWSYENLLGRIAGIVMFCVAVFNTYVLCRYPSYRKIREQIAEEEDKRIEARISKEVKKQAINQASNQVFGK